MTTILVVDDYVPSQRLLGFMLEQYGYAVAVALDGHHALECLATMQVHLVVTDLMMPNMDGLELTATMRADPRYAHIPVLCVTACVHEQDHVRANRVGVDMFLTKPVDSEELAHTVGLLLNRVAAMGLNDGLVVSHWGDT